MRICLIYKRTICVYTYKHMKLLKKSFGKKLKKTLKDKGKSQSELSDYLNIAQGNISRWCNGVHFPDDDKLVLINKFLGVDETHWLSLSESDLKVQSNSSLIQALSELEAENKALKEKVVEDAEYEYFKKLLKQEKETFHYIDLTIELGRISKEKRNEIRSLLGLPAVERESYEEILTPKKAKIAEVKKIK